MSRKYKKKNRDGRLAVQPNTLNQSVVLKKADMLDDKETMFDVPHTAGRKSYVQKAKEQGLYFLIKAQIRKFRIENKDSSAADLYAYIQPLFPTVFDDKDMNAGNFKKKIEQDAGWCNAFYCCQSELIDLANDRMYELLSKDNLDDDKVISAYGKVMQYSKDESEKDKIELETLRMKNKLIEAQIDKLKSGQIEDPYINSFLRDLSQLGGE